MQKSGKCDPKQLKTITNLIKNTICIGQALNPPVSLDSKTQRNLPKIEHVSIVGQKAPLEYMDI